MPFEPVVKGKKLAVQISTQRISSGNRSETRNRDQRRLHVIRSSLDGRVHEIAKPLPRRFARAARRTIVKPITGVLEEPLVSTRYPSAAPTRWRKLGTVQHVATATRKPIPRVF